MSYGSGARLTVTGSPPGYEQVALEADPELGDTVFGVPSQLVAQETGWAWGTMDEWLWDEPAWLPLPLRAAPRSPGRRRRWRGAPQVARGCLSTRCTRSAPATPTA